MNRLLLFGFFFISGFCSLLYQVVWTRLAFASFGIIAAVVSVVISVFMLGLAVGSWQGGRWIGPLVRQSGLSAIFFYGLVESLIGVGTFAVPALFKSGTRLLLSAGEMGSARYLFFSAMVICQYLLQKLTGRSPLQGLLPVSKMIRSMDASEKRRRDVHSGQQS